MNKFSKTIVSVTLGTALLLSTGTNAAAATYTVKSGDTLSVIASKYGTTYKQLMTLNGLKSTSIKVGQKLQVGNQVNSSTSTASKTTTYTVKSGDSLSKIASKYATTTSAIMKLNGLKSTTINVGQKLTLSTVASTQTTSSASSNIATTKANVVTIAKSLIGKPYKFGGSTPAGFDCSGYIYYVLKQAGSKMDRLTAAGYYNKAKKVTSPQVGDLVFFSNTYKKGISHAGIYIGNGQMVSASGSSVKIAYIHSGYWAKYFTSYGRL